MHAVLNQPISGAVLRLPQTRYRISLMPKEFHAHSIKPADIRRGSQVAANKIQDLSNVTGISWGENVSVTLYLLY